MENFDTGGNSDVQNPIGVFDMPQEQRYTYQPLVRAAEKPLIDLAERIDGFGGYYFDREMEGITLLLTDLENEHDARQKFLMYLNQNLNDISRIISIDNIELVKVNYTFDQLSLWRDVVRSSVLKIDGVVSFDLAEDKNRIFIGVESALDVGKVESYLETLEIPRSAFEIVVEGKIVSAIGSSISPEDKPVVTSNELDAKFRPLIGGVRLGTCTLGITAVWQNQDVFITNAHCTDEFGSSLPPDDFRQPNQHEPNDYVGDELYDPSPPDGRWADAALIELASGITNNYGSIVRTTGRSWQWQFSGPKEIYDIDPDFEIVKDDRSAFINMAVTKTGWITGATGGYVTHTCKDFNHYPEGKEDGPKYLIKCQVEAAPLFNKRGDSGSPVFCDGVSQEGEVDFMGILWGKPENTEAGIFTPVSGLKTDLNTSTKKLYFYPGIDVTVSGPTLIDGQGNYEYDAVVANTEGSVSYSWSIMWEGSSSWTNLGTSSSQVVSVNDDKKLYYSCSGF